MGSSWKWKVTESKCKIKESRFVWKQMSCSFATRNSRAVRWNVAACCGNAWMCSLKPDETLFWNKNKIKTRDSRTDARHLRGSKPDGARCGIMVGRLYRGGSGHSCHFWQKADARSCSSLSLSPSLRERAFIYVCPSGMQSTNEHNIFTKHNSSSLLTVVLAFSRFKILFVTFTVIQSRQPVVKCKSALLQESAIL